MPSFDLRLEPWIPVIYTDGTAGGTGLQEALTRAHEIREIYTDSPAEVIALNRLLLALTVRIFPDTEGDEWFSWWDEGAFDEDQITDYFSKWEDRFDLLDAKYPFYQVTEKQGEKLQPIIYLNLDESAYTSSLFSHDDLKEDKRLSLAEAARGIVTTQYSSIGGLSSQPFRYTFNAPFIKKGVVWIRGETLFHSLMLNAPPDPDARMGGKRKGDKPVWEAKDEIASEKRPHLGLLDYLTWQSRRLAIEVEEDEEGQVMATGLRITGGDTVDPEVTDDPMIAYSYNDRTKGLLPLGFREDRVLWRDSTVLFTRTDADKGAHPPLTLQWLDDEYSIASSYQLYLEVFGLVTDRAKISLWQRESIPLYSSYLYDPSLSQQLQLSLERAEDQVRILRSSGRRIFDILPSTSDEQADRARALDLEGRYWSLLREPFYNHLEALVKSEDKGEVLRSWTERLHRTALEAFDNATRALDASGRQLHAVAIARKGLRPAAPYRQETLSTTNETITP